MDRAFKIFDLSCSGKVSLDEYTETLSQLVGNNHDGAIQFLFNIYDENGKNSVFLKCHDILNKSTFLRRRRLSGPVRAA